MDTHTHARSRYNRRFVETPLQRKFEETSQSERDADSNSTVESRFTGMLLGSREVSRARSTGVETEIFYFPRPHREETNIR